MVTTRSKSNTKTPENPNSDQNSSKKLEKSSNLETPANPSSDQNSGQKLGRKRLTSKNSENPNSDQCSSDKLGRKRSNSKKVENPSPDQNSSEKLGKKRSNLKKSENPNSDQISSEKLGRKRSNLKKSENPNSDQNLSEELGRKRSNLKNSENPNSDQNSSEKLGRKRLKSKSKKPANCDYKDFPLELLAEIFARLPVKTLLKFRCVCKEWQSLIDSPNFACLHLNLYNCDHKIAPFFVIEGKYNSPKCSIRGSDTFRRICKFDLPRDLGVHKNMLYVNGLMLLWNNSNYLETLEDGLTLWNPSIRKSIEVPLCNSVLAKDVRVGLGYDTVGVDFKVVIIVRKDTPWRDCPPPEPLLFPVSVGVYSLRSRSWKSSTIDTHCAGSLRFTDTAVFFNTAIHWIGCDVTMVPYPVYGSHVMAFDVQNEVFNYFLLPEGRAVHRERELAVLGESLVLLDLFPGCSLMWVMEQYGVSESWVKRCTIDLEYENFLCFKKSGELLVTMKKEGVKVYDIGSQEIKDLAKSYRDEVFFMDTFVESLVLVTEREQIREYEPEVRILRKGLRGKAAAYAAA